MDKLVGVFLLFSIVFMSNNAMAGSSVFSSSVSQSSLHTLKRMEYKEGIPSGILHAISLVETNIGQTRRYKPWPYTIRLNSYKSQEVDDIDDSFDILDNLVDLGYQNFDLFIDDEVFYSMSSFNIEEYLNDAIEAKKVRISARSIIKYFNKKKEASKFLDKLLKRNWTEFKVGIMQLSYQDIKNSPITVHEALNTYDNINVMVKQLKEIRKKHTWWESVGLYHSKKTSKSKRYAKNVWSMYQRVHKIKVK